MKPDLQHFPPAAMSARPRLIVCERTGIWAARIRRHLPREMQLRQTRSLEECVAELRLAPGSFVVIEASAANLRDVLDLAAALGRRYPLARFAAVAARCNQEYEGLLREAGAVHFTTSPRTAQDLVGIALAHATRVPQPRTTLAAQIWESLPWYEAATG